ncbi:hypothetical protein [Stigmatella erecta]|uniref:hypothetical protein n=1 Tax=Stigmatella erecta TaxID=83460 RepID=UPI001160A4C3|nr:hypothetical protein [Stigmatella erecta]
MVNLKVGGKEPLIQALRLAHDELLAELNRHPEVDRRMVKSVERACRQYHALQPRKFGPKEAVSAGALVTLDIQRLQTRREVWFVGYENFAGRELWTRYGFPEGLLLVDEFRLAKRRKGERWAEDSPNSQVEYRETFYKIVDIE